MRIKNFLFRIGIGLIAGLLVATIAAIVSSALQLPASAIYIVVVLLGIIIAAVFTWLLEKHARGTARWSAGVLFVVGSLLILASYSKVWANIQWNPEIVGIGIGLVSIAIADFAWMVSTESDDRMKAMANLEFYEKIAVIETHIANVRKGDPIVVGTVYNDIKAAMQLKKWVNPTIKQQLDDKVHELINVALAGQHAALVRQLQNMQQEDC